MRPQSEGYFENLVVRAFGKPAGIKLTVKGRPMNGRMTFKVTCASSGLDFGTLTVTPYGSLKADFEPREEGFDDPVIGSAVLRVRAAFGEPL